MTEIKPNKVRVHQIQQQPPIWRYEVLEMDGRLIEVGQEDFESEGAAQAAGDVHARKIRRDGFLHAKR